MSTATAPTARRSGWLFGPATDLALGAGGASVAVMLLQAVVGDDLATWVPGALLILLFAVPHYGATLLRVYEDPDDRRRYRRFAAVSAVVVGTALVGGLYLPVFGSVVLTIYLTWSPWHYTGQNYGITLMLLGRRGVAVPARAKRLLHRSFVLSFLLTAVAIHSGSPEGTYAPVSYGGTVFSLLPLGIPLPAVTGLIVVLGAAWMATIGGAVWILARGAGLAAIAPAVLLIAVQALWFVVPVPVRHFDLAGADSVFRSVYTAYGFLWIAAYHSVQYLWITTYFATEQRKGAAPAASAPSHTTGLLRRGLFLGKSALLGYAVWTIPALAFAPGALGHIPQEAGLSLLVAATVNLHHFLLDGAIWKLRDGRIARILLDTREADAAAPIGPTSGRGLGAFVRPLAFAAGAACIVYTVAMAEIQDFGFAESLRRGDITSARTAMQRLAWAGRDGPARHTELGRRLAREGDYDAAQEEFARSLELHPTERAWRSMAQLHEQRDQWREAANAYDSALALAPDDPSVLFRQGQAWLRAGQPERAVVSLERARALAPNEKIIGLNLARARRESQGSR